MGDSANSIFKIEKLSDKNYNAWAFRMRAVLKEKKVWHAIVDDAPVATATEAVKRRWSEDNEKAKDLMGLAVGDGDIPHIERCEDAKDAWTTLRNLYREASLSGRVRVLKRIFRTTLENGGSMRDHVNVMMCALDELAGMEKPMEDDMAVSVLLASLGSEYDALVTAIESWEDSKITFVNVKSKLLEEWKKKSDTIDHSSALRVKVDSAVSCHYCKQSGHMKWNCPKLAMLDDGKKRFEDGRDSAKTARFEQW